MKHLNLPDYSFRIRKNASGKDEIFDEFRKKYFVLTPEEWVRQNFIKYLNHEKNFPVSLIAIERGIKVNSMQKRFDAVIFDRKGNPIVLIEFKSPDVRIDQKVMEQISRYNLTLNVSYLIVSNGLVHYCCIVDRETGKVTFLNSIPNFDDIQLKL